MKAGKLKKILAAVLSSAMVLTGMGTTAFAAPAEDENVKDAAKHKVWVVGDSTVCDYVKDAEGGLTDANYYYPRYGYGTQLANYFDDSYEVINIALSGRSSLDFLDEANYMALTKGGPAYTSGQFSLGNVGPIKEGDVLIIGFGHNDEKAEVERYTNPNGDYKTEGSFAKNLYDKYVKVAVDAKATPILCTPICRRNDSGVLGNNDRHITTGTAAFPGGDYPAAIRKLAADTNTTLVDLTDITATHYASVSANGTLYMHAWTGDNLEGEPGEPLTMVKIPTADNTHLNIFGAKWVAYQLAKQIESTGIDLALHIKAGIVEPTKEKDLTPNPLYEHEYYAPPKAWSARYKDYIAPNGVAFHGTVMGKSVALDNAVFRTEPGTGNAIVKTFGEKGKITTTEDSFAFCFAQVPSDAEFTFTAKATVNSIGEKNPNQIAFGLMARDDVLIDGVKKESLADYVVAGTFCDKAVNCFRRKGGSIEGKEALDNVTLAKGQTYNLSLAKNPDGFACSFADGPMQTGGYDFQLTTKDRDYQYVGMMVARSVDVTFSDVKLEVTCHDKHTFEDVYVDAPTCMKKGTQINKCIWCGKENGKLEEADILPHDYQKVVKEADCGHDGEVSKRCSMCGELEPESVPEITPATGEHVWDEGKITTPATEAAEGVKTYTCTVCGDTKTEKIAKLTAVEKTPDKTPEQIQAEVTQQQNKERDKAATTGGVVAVKQAAADNTVIKQELTSKGKTKSLEIVALGDKGNTSKERVDFYVTVNAGTKYLIKNGEYAVVSANNGSVTDNAKDIKKIAACKAKNGNTTLTVKALKDKGVYKATLWDEKENAYIHLTIQNLKLPKVTEVTALCGTEIAFTTVDDKKSDIVSAEWYFGKVRIGTGAANATDLVKGKKNYGKAYVNPETGNVVVTIAKDYTKGNVKLTATVNKKKYNTKLKIVPN